jgi:CO dehydrogenase nickel-insertion accessory protein CooC1
VACGGKGGVGKTTVATAIADYYAVRGISATLFDALPHQKSYPTGVVASREILPNRSGRHGRFLR